MIWLLACTSESPPVAPDPALGAAAAARSAAQVRAEGAADALTETMKATLMDAMKQGPAAAVAACADQAQGAAALALAGRRARAGRATTRLRNPNNRPPDWVVPWLEEHGDGALEDAVPAVHIAELEPGAFTARIIRPLAVQPLCLSCHGEPDAIPAEIAVILAERYPRDQATGYSAGDLRGAVWAEATVSIEP